MNIKMIRLVLIYICIFLAELYAQVFNGNLTLTSQLQIDNFNFTSVTGRLLIREQVPGNITNLDGLSELSYAGELSIFGNTLLTNITGLSNLDSTGNLSIYSNAALTNLQGLSNLSYIGQNVSISENPSLTDISGLSNISFIGFHLIIADNRALTNVDGLLNITSLPGNLDLINNDALADLSGLSNLTTIGSNLQIINNDALQNLNGLSGVRSLRGVLWIEDNDELIDIDALSGINSLRQGSLFIFKNAQLKNLDGLSGLFFIRENVQISGNPSLENLDGLSNLTLLNFGSIEVTGNTALTSFCGLYTLFSSGFKIPATISGNAVNPAVQQIINDGPCTPMEIPHRSFIASLRGKNLLPPVVTDVAGGGTFTLNENADTLKYWIRISGIPCRVEEAYFQNGSEGVEGPVVKTFTNSFSVSDKETAIGIWTSSDSEPLTPALVDEMLKGNIYAKIHTQLLPEGAVRGQITSDQPMELYANLDGSQETPPVITPGSGEGTFVLSGDGDSLTYDIAVENLSASISAAHFHKAVSGLPGPVIKPISFNGDNSTGVWANNDPQPLTPLFAADLLASFLYINVHTSNHPNGEVRGQIYKTENINQQYMTFWTATNNYEQSNSILISYSLAEGNKFKSFEGDIVGYTGIKNIEDLTIDAGGNFYFLNNSWTSMIYKINSSQIDFNSSTPVTAKQVGKTRILADEKLVHLSKIKFIKGKLYGFDNEANKLYSISTNDASVTGLTVLNDLESMSAGFTLAADGNVYILKSINETLSEIWKFDQFPSGNLSLVTEVVSFSKLQSFTAHPSGNLYAADKKNLYEINLTEQTVGVLKDYEVDVKGIDFNFFAEKNSDAVETLEFNIISGVTSVDQFAALPADYNLAQNYPNPFNPSTIIKFGLPDNAFVNLSIFNILGEKVADVISEFKEAGYHSISFNASSLSSGTYIYKITAGDFVDSKKFILLK